MSIFGRGNKVSTTLSPGFFPSSTEFRYVDQLLFVSNVNSDKALCLDKDGTEYDKSTCHTNTVYLFSFIVPEKVDT